MRYYMLPQDFQTAQHIENLKVSDALLLEFGFNTSALTMAIEKFDLAKDPEVNKFTNLVKMQQQSEQMKLHKQCVMSSVQLNALYTEA